MKKAFTLGLTVFFILIISVFSCPGAVFAQAGTADTEKPSLTAVYYHELGQEVDGNKLSAGTYRMELVLTGFAGVSEMEFTADYDDSIVIQNESCNCDLDAMKSDVASLCKVGNGSIIICIVSLNDDCSGIASDGAVLFSADITVSSDVPLDMENVITIEENPNYTFVEKDYGDIDKTSVPFVYSCYGFGSNAPEIIDGALVTDMIFDMSPIFSSAFSVKGKVVAMLNPSLPDESDGAPALSGVNVLINDLIVATTGDDGIFEIPALENGTYNAVLHYANGYDRTITIIVNGASIDYTSVPITMVHCDYDNSGQINVRDTRAYNTALSKADLIDGDLNGDGSVDVRDTRIFKRFLAKTELSGIYSIIIIK